MIPRRLGVWMRLLVLGCLVLASAAWAATQIPALTGRVVDGAHILDVATQAKIETKLRDLEDKSGIQLVVATIPSLDGQDIAPVANDIFRAWKLGETKKNNGVLLLIAPNEHKLRIEVGYGLEGTLTDALSSVIITNSIVPKFKDGDFDGGVARGVDDIIAVLTTDSAEWQKRPTLRQDQSDDATSQGIPFIMILIFLFVFFIMMRNGSGGIFLGGGGWGGGSGGGGWSGGGGDGGGFSGGGGSSGGGGASGGW